MTLLGALARLHVDFVVRDDLVFLKLKYDVVDLVIIQLDTLKFCEIIYNPLSSIETQTLVVLIWDCILCAINCSRTIF